MAVATVGRVLLWGVIGLGASCAQAREIVFKPLVDGVYVYTADTGGRSYENDALNANLGLLVTDAGAVLIDSGTSHMGAQKIAEAVRKVTNQPIRWVLNSGGQDQRWLGNGYFKEQGAETIGHAAGRRFMESNGGDFIARLRPVLKDKLRGTLPTLPTRWLDGPENTLVFGSTTLQALHRGGGHTPGDMLLWLPQHKVVFAGDVVYTERMLGMNPGSRTKPWLATFAAMESLQPTWVVPGHGGVTHLERAQKDTKTLLQALRSHMGKAVQDLQDMDTAIKSFDPSPFKYLQHADVWLPQLANRTFLDMEKE